MFAKTTLVYDFVASYDTNNVACLFDTIGEQFYYSSSTLEIVYNLGV